MKKPIWHTATYFLLLLTLSCNSRSTYTLFATFDKVDGLYEKSEVKINGYKVGSVARMDIRNGDIVATLNIDSKVRISSAAVFTIKNSDLLGTKYIEVHGAAGSNRFLADGDSIKGQFGGEILASPVTIDSLVLKVAKPILGGLGYDVIPKREKQTDNK